MKFKCTSAILLLGVATCGIATATSWEDLPAVTSNRKLKVATSTAATTQQPCKAPAGPQYRCPEGTRMGVYEPDGRTVCIKGGNNGSVTCKVFCTKSYGKGVLGGCIAAYIIEDYVEPDGQDQKGWVDDGCNVRADAYTNRVTNVECYCTPLVG